MFVPYVIDTVTNIRYTIDQYPLGEGATAKVWKGIAEADPSGPVAVKVAHQGTTADLLEEFWGELAVLEALSRTEARVNVPWAHRGKAPDAAGAAVIVMELVPDEWQMTRHAAGTGGKIPEDLVLRTGLQYARLLSALHTNDFATKGDRKATDLRWDPAGQRLVVLDWNRATRLPLSDSTDSLRDELVRQDLRGFGQLWSEFALGRRVTSLPPVDDGSDADWISLTRGLRVVLHRALGSRASWGYREATELIRDIEGHSSARALSQSQPSHLLQQAESVRAQATRSREAAERSSLADHVLTLADLLTRARDIEPLNEAQIEALRSWADEHISTVLLRAAEAAERMQGRLRLGDYRSAVQIAREALSQLNGREFESQQASLLLTRWLTVAQAGLRGNELRQDMSSTIQGLQEAVRGIESGALQVAQSALAQAQRDTIEEIRSVLDPLVQEISVRGNAAAASRAQDEGRDDAAESLWEEAVETWREIEQSDPAYAESLRADIGALDSRLSQKALREGASELLRQKRALFAEALDGLLQTLQSDGTRGWIDLTSDLASARGCYQEIRSLSPGPTDTDRAHYGFVSWLGDVNSCMLRGDVPRALERIQGARDTLEYYAIARARCQTAALYEATRLADEGRWPDELDQAMAIVQELKTFSSLPPAVAPTAMADIAEALGQWRDKLAELRRRLGLIDAGRFTNDPNVAVSDIGNREIDEVFEDALAFPIEIFDRGGLLDEEAARCQVSSLLALRRIARLVHEAKGLADQVQGISERLQSESANLQSQLIQARNTLGSKLAEDLASQSDSLSRQAAEIEEIIRTVNKQSLRLKQARHALNDERHRISPQVGEDLRPAILNALIASGLQAVRELRLHSEAGAYGADQWLERARQWALVAEEHDPRMRSSLNLLEESVDWLSKVERDGLLDTLTKWRAAILDRDLSTAESAWQDLVRSSGGNSEILSQWVVGELRGEQYALQAQGQAAQRSALPDQSPEVLQQRSYSENTGLLAQLEDLKTQDDPERLDTAKRILEQLEAHRGFSAGEQHRLSAVADWYKSRQALADSARGLAMRWSDLLRRNAFPTGELQNVLEDTNALVTSTPANLLPYWKSLGEQLAAAYESRQAHGARSAVHLFIWLGILSYRYTSPRGATAVDRTGTERAIRQVADSFAAYRSSRNTSSFLGLSAALRGLAMDADLDPRQAARQAADLVWAEEIFADIQSKGRDPRGLAEVAEWLDRLWNIAHLSDRQRQELQSWSDWHQQRKRFIEGAYSLQDRLKTKVADEQLEEIIAEADQLIRTAPSDLPAAYWQSLEPSIWIFFKTLKQGERRTSERWALLVWSGMLYYRVKQRGSSASPAAVGERGTRNRSPFETKGGSRREQRS